MEIAVNEGFLAYSYLEEFAIDKRRRLKVFNAKKSRKQFVKLEGEAMTSIFI